MHRWTLRWMKRLALLATGAVAALVVARAVESQFGPPLELWHTEVPVEPRASTLDSLDWPGWLAAETRAFDDMRRRVTDRLPEAARIPANRYFAGSPLYPPRFATDWNRSYLLEPAGAPRGAVVLLHGLTDAPYSLRHVAGLYRDAGFVAVGLRTPGHGTVPAGLTDTKWEDWLAATRLAMREARRRVGPDRPVHLVGFSNGAAMALKHALDAIENPALVRADRLVLVSPMIGVSAFARFAGLAGLPAALPAFAGAAWLSRLPEFNPFKYNSFPVNGARQSHRLTAALQAQLRALARDGRLAGLAPVLSFQSVFDSTVSTPAVIDALYALLPANGSELVLFDRNRASKLGVLLRPADDDPPARLVGPAPRAWRLTVITNAGAQETEVVERSTQAGATEARERRLGLDYPLDVFSMSHVGLPFPAHDSLYGHAPVPEDEFGVGLGTVAARGETGVLIVALGSLMRISWNPFFPYLADRMLGGIAAP